MLVSKYSTQQTGLYAAEQDDGRARMLILGYLLPQGRVLDSEISGISKKISFLP